MSKTPDASAEPVLLSTDAGRARIFTLNRPARKNALTSELGWAIGTAIREAALDDDVWAIGITGAGDAFCSGLDLTNADRSQSPISSQDASIDDLGWIGRIPVIFREICDKPIVGGINGVAIGAGLSLGMATDIRIASESARFLAGYARMATSPDGGLTFTLVQTVGYEKAMRFLFEPKMTPATEAKEIGLVSEVVPDDRFEARFHEVLASLANLSPIATRQTKRMLHRATFASDLAAHVASELVSAQRGLRSEDSQEARKAVMEKRTPEYRGR